MTSSVTDTPEVKAELPYKILTSKYRELEPAQKIKLDSANRKYTGIFSIPIIARASNKVAINYRKYLDENAFSNNDLLKAILYICKMGLEHKEVALICDCALGREKHSVVLKSFIEDNMETLNMLIPYFYQNKAFSRTETESIENDLSVLDPSIKEEVKNSLMYNENAKTLADLPESDRLQIEALIKADMLNTKNETQVELTTSDDITETQESIIDSKVSVTSTDIEDAIIVEDKAVEKV